MRRPRFSKLPAVLSGVPVTLLGAGIAASSLQASCSGENNANPDWLDAATFDRVQPSVNEASEDSPGDRADGMSYGDGYLPPPEDAHVDSSCVSSTVTYPPAPGCPPGNHTWACWAPTSAASVISDSHYAVRTLCGAAVVVDTNTHLMWAQNVEPAQHPWVAAAAACAGSRRAGFSDWRLPSSNELMSLVDYASTTEAIDADVFDGPAGTVWSSTPYAQASGHAWQLTAAGGVYPQDVSTQAYVRCVR
ncbi:MAG TPA: DUF1566 domain-containing protein [Polyangiaceae bacterium]